MFISFILLLLLLNQVLFSLFFSEIFHVSVFALDSNVRGSSIGPINEKY
jgi:hypothetical protein